MSDEVASLGFAVDSGPLDAAKQKLSDIGEWPAHQMAIT
jgi:hypothetical protein